MRCMDLMSMSTSPGEAENRQAHLVKIEYKVKFTDIAEVAIQHLHIVVHDLQGDELIVASINAHHKVQAGIPLVHHLPQIKGPWQSECIDG